MKILVTGSTGLVGSRFIELLQNSYEFDFINSSTGIDILDKTKVLEKITSSRPDMIIHFAAKTNVDGCEEDKTRDKEILGIKDQNEKEAAWLNEKTAWAINVFGTANVVKACEKNKIKLIHISTDFVFDGTRKSYNEESEVHAVNWYGETKLEAEKVVKSSDVEYLIVRPAYPYRAIHEKRDFVRAILNKLNKGEQIKAVSDHVMTPTFIDDLVNGLDVLINKEEKGIFHLVGSQTVTPYNAAIKIAKKFNLDDSNIVKTTRSEYFKDKAQRPFCLNLKNDKIGRLGIEMSTFDKGLIEVKNQLEQFSL